MKNNQEIIMARRKNNKAAFVRGLGSEANADDVVAKAKEAGFEISKGYVHTIHSEMRAKANKEAKRQQRPQPHHHVSPGPALAKTRSSEHEFRRLVIEDLGVKRAAEMLEDVEAALKKVVAG